MAESTRKCLLVNGDNQTNIVDHEFSLDPTHMFLEFPHAVLDKVISKANFIVLG